MGIDPDCRTLKYATAVLFFVIGIVLLSTGCATTERVVLPPTEVKLAVAQPCVTADQVPEAPDYHLLPPGHVERLAGILVERQQARKYIASASAVMAACVGAVK